ncbi:MAG: prolyl oligopeptidase family serine peptidase, partial [Bacteroidota bacterium]
SYKIEESLEEDGKWYYLISFDSEMDTTNLIKTRKNGSVTRRTKPDLMSGKIWIDEENEAITRISYSIPTHLKKFVCAFRENNIRHFDYKVDLYYSQQGGKYLIDHIRQEDEFIFHDTISGNTIPYRAIAELYVRNVTNKDVETFKKDEIFYNTDSNQLFSYPLTYNGGFWEAYVQQVPQAVIGEDIRKAMETEKPMERQFKEKVIRNENMPAPVAEEKPYEYRHLGERYSDPYAWMKDTINPRSNNQVMDYLEAENRYTDNYFNPLRGLQRGLFKEMMRRVDHNYTSLPTKIDDYEYFYRYLPDEEYERWYRKKIGSDSVELLLDNVSRAAGKPFYAASPTAINPSGNIMAYAENTDGSDVATHKFMDLTTRRDLPDSIRGIGNVVWKDDTHFFYLQLDKKTNRAYQVKFHALGSDFANDPIIYEESDTKFGVGISRTKSKEFFVLGAGSTTSSESYIMRSDDPTNQFQMVHPRTENMIYSVDHHQDKFYIMTNKNTPNFEVMVTDTSNYQMKNWKKFITGRKGLMINGFLIFDNYFVVSEKKAALDLIRVIDAETMKSYYVKNKWNLANFSIESNPDFDTDSLQYSYSSPSNPSEVVLMHMGTKKTRIVKKQTVKYFSSWGMKVERHWAVAGDGTEIPITVIYRRWNKKSKASHKKMLLSGYGAYGSSTTVGFNRNVTTLLNRGFTVAYAHVRGGSEMGREWYEDGKMLNKKNSFTDFIACTEYLIEKGFATKGDVTISGGSAGGLLVGAVANMRPDLYKAVILDVPFVDVINTMLDDQLPLTTGEYEEWGNPANKKYFDYIRSYSPYDNVKEQNYPAMFFFTGLNDSRVSYWEPAKMVAKLRKMKTDDNPLLLKTDFFSGHGGSSGRFSNLQQLSYKYALIFELYAIKKDDEPTTP